MSLPMKSAQKVMLISWMIIPRLRCIYLNKRDWVPIMAATSMYIMRYLPLYRWMSGLSITDPSYHIMYLRLPSKATTLLLLTSMHGFAHSLGHFCSETVTALMRCWLTHNRTKTSPAPHLPPPYILMNDLSHGALLLSLHLNVLLRLLYSFLYLQTLDITLLLFQFIITFFFIYGFKFNI